MSDAYSGRKLLVLMRIYEQSLGNCQTQLILSTVNVFLFLNAVFKLIKCFRLTVTIYGKEKNYVVRHAKHLGHLFSFSRPKLLHATTK